jgi:hypothetical protein
MTTEKIDFLLTELQDYEDRLTEWENDFIDHVIDDFEIQGHLTESQVEKITQIHHKLNI